MLGVRAAGAGAAFPWQVFPIPGALRVAFMRQRSLFP